jgi:hypothetical protein
MASEAQMKANRANALLSSGPMTREGKEKSRGNALRHGLSAKQVVAMDERGADFAAYHDDLTAAFRPQDAFEATLVRRLALLSWRLDRLARIEAAKLNAESRWNVGRGLPADNIWPDILPDLARYEAALDRAFKRASTLLERRQAVRRLATAALAIEAGRPAQILILQNEPNSATATATATGLISVPI